MRSATAMTATTAITSSLSNTTRRRRRRRSTSTITRRFILVLSIPLLQVVVFLATSPLRCLVHAFGVVLPSSSSLLERKNHNHHQYYISTMSAVLYYKSSSSSSPFQRTRSTRRTPSLSTRSLFMTRTPTTTTPTATTTPTTTILPPPKQSLRQVLEVTSTTTTINNTTTTTNNNPWIVGHRGCLHEELENTREGFWKCAQLQCDAVELDVFLLKCGTLVVFHGGGDDDTPGLLEDYMKPKKEVTTFSSHDDDQKKTWSTSSSILDYTYAQVLTELEFDPWGSEFACPPEIFQRSGPHKVILPTLQQVLEDAKGSGMHVKMELKGEAAPTTTPNNNNNHKGIVESVLALVEDELQMPPLQVSYSSFCHDYLRHLRKLRPNRQLVATGALFTKQDLLEGNLQHNHASLIRVALDCGATEIHLPYDECTTSRIDAIHQDGLKSMCWVRGPRGMEWDCANVYEDVGAAVESLELYQILMETGVQQFCINRPDILIAWRRRQQQEEEPMLVSSSSSFNSTTTSSSSTSGSIPAG